MKKSILLLAISLLFLSCKSDDDSGSNNSIVGTWLLTSIIENNEEIITMCERQEFYEFRDDNTFSFQVFDEREDLNEDGTVETDCVEGTLDTGIYTIEGNNIAIKFDTEDESDVSVFSINQDTLTLTFEETEIESYVRQ